MKLLVRLDTGRPAEHLDLTIELVPDERGDFQGHAEAPRDHDIGPGAAVNVVAHPFGGERERDKTSEDDGGAAGGESDRNVVRVGDQGWLRHGRNCLVGQSVISSLGQAHGLVDNAYQSALNIGNSLSGMQAHLKKDGDA